MKNGYEGTRSKEARIANNRQKRLEAEHSQKDAFVKKQQAQQAKHAGTVPDLKSESLHFNAYMCNNGEHAQEFGRKLTKGLDKVAFPVK